MDHPHLHATAPRGRGRPVQAYLRCVVCCKSTRSRPFIQCSEANSPGGRICSDCFESQADDQSVRNCHVWVRKANTPAMQSCEMCTRNTDQLVSCAVCDGAICEACCNSTTLDRFYATGAYEAICNACVPPDACADPDGLTAKKIGDRICTFCLVCQDYHTDTNDDYIQCDIDLHELSPLARLCIETRARELSKKRQNDTPVPPAPIQESSQVAPRNNAATTALEIQRDNTLIALQVQVESLEKRLSSNFERKLSLQMQDLKLALGLEGKDHSLSKSVQTCPKDLRESEALFKKAKAKENPTQAIIESLPAIMERIARGLESVNHSHNPQVSRAETSDPPRVNNNRVRKPRRGPNNNRGRNSNQPRNPNDSRN